MQTGVRIKQRRKQLDISADVLAEKLGVSRSTIFRYESGDIEKVPLNYLGILSTALHTTPAYLMGWSDDPDCVAEEATALPSSDLTSSPDSLALLEAYHSAAPDKQAAIRILLGLK